MLDRVPESGETISGGVLVRGNKPRRFHHVVLPRPGLRIRLQKVNQAAQIERPVAVNYLGYAVGSIDAASAKKLCMSASSKSRMSCMVTVIGCAPTSATVLSDMIATIA